MSATLPRLHRQWEVVSCSNPECEYGHVRRAEGRAALPCSQCGAEMLTFAVELVGRPTNASVVTGRARVAGLPKFGIEDLPGAIAGAAERMEELASKPKALNGPDALLTRASYRAQAVAYRECLLMVKLALGIPIGTATLSLDSEASA